MSIIKETIKFDNRDTNIKFSLSEGVRQSGYQQEIDNITEETKDDLVNPIVDNEVRRFQYDSTTNASYLVFYFSFNGTIQTNSFLSNGAGFTTDELNSNNSKIQNSFFIMDFYDTYDNNTQTKIFTTYLTKITDGFTTGSNPIPKYKIYKDTVNQLYSWYVPKSFLDSHTGSTITGYIKFSFYNAKYGTLALFYNKDNQGLSTPEKQYFKVRLNRNTMTWTFNYSGSEFPPDATAYQIPFNDAYSQRVNTAVTNFDNKQQVYPTGNTFQRSDGDYTTT